MSSNLPNIAQAAFTAGELTPALHSRVDLQKYRSGAKTLKNVFAHIEGGVSNRPGTKFLYDLGEPGRLIPFEYNVEQNYVLCFASYKMLVLKDNSIVLRALQAYRGYKWTRCTGTLSASTYKWLPSQLTNLNDGATYKWTASGSGTGEFYMELFAGGDPSISEPVHVREDGVAMVAGTAGALTTSTWDYADNDTLGYSTIYVRLADDADPDGKASGFVQSQAVHEYYLQLLAGGDPNSTHALIRKLYKSAVELTAGTVGSLAAGESGYDDNDSLGYDTWYARTATDVIPASITFDRFEFYCEAWKDASDTTARDPMFTARSGEPAAVNESGSPMAVGTMHNLLVGEWDWGNTDTLGFNTIYLRLSDSSDPNDATGSTIAAAEYGNLTQVTTDIPFDWVPGNYSSWTLQAVGGGNPADLEGLEPRQFYLNGTLLTKVDDVADIAATDDAFAWGNSGLAYSTIFLHLEDELSPYQRQLLDSAEAEDAYWLSTPYQIATIYSYANLAALRYCQSADVMFLACPSLAPHELSRADHDDWSFDTMTFGPSIATPSAPTVTQSADLTVTTDGWTYKYVITAISEGGEESLQSDEDSVQLVEAPSDMEAADYISISIPEHASADVIAYKIYKNCRGNWGFIGEVEHVDGSGPFEFKDDNYDPDTAQGLPVAKDPFDGTDNYPGAITIHQQRLFFGRSNNSPQTLWSSMTGAFNNLNIHRPLIPTDAITATIASTQVNEIKHLVSKQDMYILTSGAFWRMSSEGGLSPTSMQLTQEGGASGASDVPPLIVDNSLLLVARNGRTVLDLTYDLATDGQKTTNMSVLSAHLFEGKQITSWAYQASPYHLLWVTLDDGTLLTFTYLREQEVWAWTRHESVAELQEGLE